MSAVWTAVALVLALSGQLRVDERTPSPVGHETGPIGTVQSDQTTALTKTIAAQLNRLGVPTAPTSSTRASHQRNRGPRSLLVHVHAQQTIRARPNAHSRAIGSMPGRSKYYGVPLVAWVRRVSADNRWGKVEVPYAWPHREGWIHIDGLARAATGYRVDVDLSRHRLEVSRLGHRLLTAPAATGASTTPTPPGQYFVTDRISFSAGSSYGAFAFGLSGIQPHLPLGWSGGNQLAIHGTNDPASIGRSVSAGCVRVGATVLQRLEPLLRLGTPVVIRP